jgi:hypothetical protein
MTPSCWAWQQQLEGVYIFVCLILVQGLPLQLRDVLLPSAALPAPEDTRVNTQLPPSSSPFPYSSPYPFSITTTATAATNHYLLSVFFPPRDIVTVSLHHSSVNLELHFSLLDALRIKLIRRHKELFRNKL